MEKKGLILIPFLTGFGGTETVINNLFTEYNKNRNKFNINLKLYSLGGYINGDWLEFRNVRIFQFPKERYVREFLYLFILPFLILYSIIKEKPNFIISTNPIMWTIAKLTACVLHKRIKIIAWYHFSYKLKPVTPYCLNKADYFFTISKSGKEELIDLGINKNKIFIVYDPINPTNHIIKSSRCHNNLVYVGRLEYKSQKNISELFKALSFIRNKSWELNIYGTGPGKKSLIQLSKELGISNHINWKGFVENPLNHINYADALVLTSTYEGFSMVIAEALSNGLYVISSDCPSGPSDLINGRNGNLYIPGNIKQLSKLIMDVLYGKKVVDPYYAKRSINKYYVGNYFYRFMDCLQNILIKK